MPLGLVLELSLGQMMAEDWVVPLVPLRLSVTICDKAVPQVLWGPQVVKIGIYYS